MTYEICYIDDRLLPRDAVVANEFGLISKDEIKSLMAGSDNWDEPTVKRFLSHTLDKSDRFKQINISGFIHPDFFLNYISDNKYSPNSLILDWDYGTSKAEEKIKEILDQTTSKILVLTGNDLKQEVENILSELRKIYPDRI